jgi:hypothetical protein
MPTKGALDARATGFVNVNKYKSRILGDNHGLPFSLTFQFAVRICSIAHRASRDVALINPMLGHPNAGPDPVANYPKWLRQERPIGRTTFLKRRCGVP